MEKNILNCLDKSNIPKHIAIIMDGNGRWAKKRFLPRTFGHKAGVETIREIVKECSSLGVKYLTLYAFSTENWKRPKDEVSALMNLLVQYLKKEIKELHENNVIFNTIGDISYLPGIAAKEIEKSKELTKYNTGLTLTLALNYGSRHDIKNAIVSILEDYKNEKIGIDDVDEDFIRNYLSTKSLPDPDILVRPSGEYRISNFLLWEIAYSEFWFSDIYWPDFRKENLHKLILDYQNRERRFGGLK